MSSIAYITDHKMLDNHRLNQNKTMNFWRLSTRVNFTNFSIGGLVFFLSKNKEHLSSKKEKGIIGFGRVKDIYVLSPKVMWKKFGKENGYNSYKEFVEAIKRFSKDHKVPKKISSLYLENVSFYQTPIYLSECGIEISNNVESYVYIKPDEAVIELLEYGKKNVDIWSGEKDQIEIIDEEEIGAALALAHEKTLDIKNYKRIPNDVKKYLKENDKVHLIHTSMTNMYKVTDNKVNVILYHTKSDDIRTIIGQTILYKKYFKKYYPKDVELEFKTIDNIFSDKDYIGLI